MWYDVLCSPAFHWILTIKTAAAKGLIAGNFALRRADGSSVRGLCEEQARNLLSLQKQHSSNLQGILVPNIHEADLLDLSSVHWILVIEKEVGPNARHIQRN